MGAVLFSQLTTSRVSEVQNAGRKRDLEEKWSLRPVELDAGAVVPNKHQWPSRNRIMLQSAVDFQFGLPGQFDNRLVYGGVSSFLYRIRGVTKDSGGTPISNVTVSLYRTSDKAFLRSAVSKDGGQYDLAADDNTTTNFIVAYRAGPDIEGTTVNTLLGT